jgi:chloramphenicol O-acetyltransferase type B
MTSKIPELTTSDNRISIGKFTYGNPKFMLWGESERIEIGAFCSIAEEVTIFAGGEHRTDWATTFPLRIAFEDPQAGKDGHPTSKGLTKIGNDVWIGFRAIILSGVTIGDGAVIGAGAVVSQDVLPYSIVAGNPAKFIRYRFDEDQIKRLLELEWWNWDISKIEHHISVLSSPDLNFLFQI